MRYLSILILLSSSLYGQNVGESRRVIQSWENGGRNAIIGELLEIVQIVDSGGIKYSRSDGSFIWSSPLQYSTRTETYTDQSAVGTIAYNWFFNDTGSTYYGIPAGEYYQVSGIVTRVDPTYGTGESGAIITGNTYVISWYYPNTTDVSSSAGYMDVNEDIQFSFSQDWDPHNQNDAGTDHGSGDDQNDSNQSDVVDDDTVDSGETDTGGSDSSSSSSGDQDNDVPMLTNIYNRLAELDSDDDNQNLENIWNRQANIAGQIEDIDDYSVRMTELADIEKSLRRIETKILETRGEFIDENGTKTGNYASLKDVVDAISGVPEMNATGGIDFSGISNDRQTSISSDFQTIADKTKKTINPNLTGGRPGFMDAPMELTILGKSVKYMPLNPSNSYGSQYTRKLEQVLPDRNDIFTFIRRAILIVVFALYYFANYKLLFTSTDTLIKSNESNTVSSYTIFGINIGGGVLKGLKFGVWATFIGGIGFTTMMGLADSGIDFSLDAVDAAIALADPDADMIDQIVSLFVVWIAGISEWAYASVSMFLSIVPIVTITSALTTYYFNKTLIYGSILAMNRANRAAS